MIRISLTGALVALFYPVVLSAQVAMGTVTDQSTRAPVRGAFVQLLDATGRQVSGLLTDERGTFVFRAAPGRYSLKADRIGHRTGTAEAFTLTAGETRTFTLSLEVAALRLKEISVTSGSRCASRPTESRQTAEVWAEVRKALTVAAWVESAGATFQTRTYTRDLDTELRLLAPPTYRFKKTTGKQAFSAEKPDTLARYGYIREVGSDVVLYGPDEELLLSNSFLSQHCFKLERRTNRPGLLGLGFEPVRDRKLPDIRGTLWLDERTAELRFIEYGYTGEEGFEDTRYAGGRTEFEQLANGAWIVRRWHVRAPRMQRVAGTRNARVLGTHEEGGEILDADIFAGGSTRLVPRHALHGIVYDSLRHVTLEGARVYLSGTPFSAVSGIGGRFVIDSVPAGEYGLSFTHPMLDSLPNYPAPVPAVVSGAMSPFNLATPGILTAVHSRCTADEIRQAREVTRDTTATGGALLYGTVTNEFGPVTGARVAARWQRIFAASGNANVPLDQISATPLELFTDSDENGNYSLCGLPVNRWLQLRIQQGSSSVQRDSVIIKDLPLRRFDLKLRR